MAHAENIHGLDERVSIPSIRRVTKTIARFIADWCGTPAGLTPAGRDVFEFDPARPAPNFMGSALSPPAAE